MRITFGRWLAAAPPGAALVLLATGAAAQPQFDVNPPLPNVLLLVDNSGSMERMIDGTLPEASTANACDVSNCVVNTGTSPPTTTCNVAVRSSPLSQFPPTNRWNTLLQVLTGTPVNGFHCIAMPRNTTPFTSEFSINSDQPYDTGYYLAYHRAVAMDGTLSATATTTAGVKPCVFAPSTLPGFPANTGGVGPSPSYASGGNANAFTYGLTTRPYGQLNATNAPSTYGGISSTCNFSQNNDGLLDTYQDLIRFGLMTFDQDPSQSTGVTTGTAPQVLTGTDQPFTGMWSYFPGWDGSSAATYATGHPTTVIGDAACTTFSPFEVGARNPDAPPWEGRMMYFPTDETQTTRDTQNVQIQQVLNSTRPYGGTPLAGMFADAQYYLSTDPNGPSGTGSGQGDPLVKGSCRKQFIVLMTDGAPNEDMRPQCGTGNDPPTPCPYDTPDQTAYDLAHPTGGAMPIYTYVIGFALSTSTNDMGTPVDCTMITPSQCTGIQTTDPMFPCCELEKIAVAGAPATTSSPRAYFANNPADLQAALGAIFAQIASTQTTRTVPTYSTAVTNVTYNTTGSTSGTPPPNQEVFYSYFDPAPSAASVTSGVASGGQPWTGDIQRARYDCGSGGPSLQAASTALGDDFAANLNTNNPTRYFVALQATTSGAASDSSVTLRPYYALSTGGDGFGNGAVQQFAGSGGTVAGQVSSVALALPSGTNSCQYTSNNGMGQQWLNSTNCAQMLMDFTFGQSFSYSGFPFVSRVGQAFGGIYHANPAVVGPPASLLHDDSYDAFTQTSGVAGCSTTAASGGSGCRQPLVYAATTDGLLHAFWSDVLTQNNNEQWAMALPAVLPNIFSSYPAADKFLLDGSPIVKDVVFDRPQGSALAADGVSNPWHTMLVAGFGPQQQGYYAVDVSKPSASSGNPINSSTPGPVFRWQLTKVPSTNIPLFGSHGATPAITTVFVGNPAHEVGVAILPGGYSNTPSTPAGNAAGCARATVAGQDASEVGSFAYRTNVQCWGANGLATDPVVGRSVTVARLDTGEILATFMRKADLSAPAPNTQYPNDTLLKAGRIVDTPLDSPMTGLPTIYPSDVGADGTQVFIADQDGTIWKFDLSNTDPTQWTGKLFFDLYNKTAETASSAWSDGQPVSLPLVMSLDPTGELVINVASGTQDTFTTTGLYFVYSLTQTVQVFNATSSLRSNVNWYLSSATSPQLTAQAGVMAAGEHVSGPMVVFDGTLYFTTYQAPASSSTVSCTGGNAHLWGRDYTKPYDSNNLYEGGSFVIPSSGPSPAYQTISNNNGAVVPGVSVQALTSCLGLGNATNDSYVAGQQHTTVSGVTQGSFALVGQQSASGGMGAAPVTLQSLPSPREPTMISSWAAVTE